MQYTLIQKGRMRGNLIIRNTTFLIVYILFVSIGKVII